MPTAPTPPVWTQEPSPLRVLVDTGLIEPDASVAYVTTGTRNSRLKAPHHAHPDRHLDMRVGVRMLPAPAGGSGNDIALPVRQLVGSANVAVLRQRGSGQAPRSVRAIVVPCP